MVVKKGIIGIQRRQRSIHIESTLMFCYQYWRKKFASNEQTYIDTVTIDMFVRSKITFNFISFIQLYIIPR